MHIQRQAIVTLAVPSSSSAARTVRMPCSGDIPLKHRIVETVRRFAREFGVAPLAVDYDVRIQGGK
jgi:hypothetical protein